MFPYTDPTGTDFLNDQTALDEYRAILQGFYRRSATKIDSTFTLLEAFNGLPDGTTAVSSIPWIAFPKTSALSFEQIDADRQEQDEYVEWLTEKDASGNVNRVIFTTELPEYYEALAEVSLDALMAGVQAVIPGANPTIEELLGVSSDPGIGRAGFFRSHLLQNPWNNGEKGILCLMQEANTMGALFSLVDTCGVSRPGTDPAITCSLPGVGCVPDRNSDPKICTATQNAAQALQGISLADPVGIQIQALEGIWEISGIPIDINNPNRFWTILRNGRRAILNVVPNMTLNGSPITSGTQVSTVLSVVADVISAPDSALPLAFRASQEARL